LQFRDSRFAGDETLTQLFVFLAEAAELYDNFVKEVINFVLVVSFAELGRLESLVDYVFRR
jgi:hypothetical protein